MSDQPEWWRGFFDAEYRRVSAAMLSPERTQRDVEGVEALVEAHLGAREGGRWAVLDVCGGDGRVVGGLDIHKYTGTVLDASPAMLDAGIKKSTAITFVEGDARSLPWADGEFDVALNLFSSIGYFEDDAEHVQIVREIARCVRVGGLVILDMTHRDHFVTTLAQPATWYTLADGSPVWRHCTFDPIEGVSHERLFWINTDGFIEERRWRCRIFTSTEIASMLRAAGLEALAWYGSLGLEPFVCDAPGLCVVARKLA